MQIVNGVVMLFVFVGSVHLSAGNCPVDSYSTNTRNVIQMCGASENQSCPVAMSSINEDNYPANNAIDGNFNTAARTMYGMQNRADRPNFIRVDLQKTRLISQVKLWMPQFGQTANRDGRLRIGFWGGDEQYNPPRATLTGFDQVINLSPAVSGRYIFVHMAHKTLNEMFVIYEIQAFASCLQCPDQQTSPAGSTSISQLHVCAYKCVCI